MQENTKIQGFERFKLILMLALMSSVAPISTDMYLPALENVKTSFQSSSYLTQLSIASFFIGFAFGQLIYGPLSDIFGRKKPVVFGFVLFVSSSIACIFVSDINLFIALRFLEALGGCAGVVIARAIVNDLFDLKDSINVFALMMVIVSLAPMLSPIFGGFLLEFFSWKSIFVTLFLLGLFLLFMIVFFFKESASVDKRAKFSFKKTILSYRIVLSNKIFMLYTLSSSFAIATIFAYITGSAFVFINFFALSEFSYSLIFALNALGFALFANINSFLLKKFNPEQILKKAFITMALFAFILCFTAFSKVSFLLFELFLFLSIAMLGFIMPNATSLAMSQFKKHSGTASATLGFIQFALAGSISFLVGLLEANTPFVLACVIFFSSFLAMLIYLLFQVNFNNTPRKD